MSQGDFTAATGANGTIPSGIAGSVHNGLYVDTTYNLFVMICKQVLSREPLDNGTD